jgi:hypothetical protein
MTNTSPNKIDANVTGRKWLFTIAMNAVFLTHWFLKNVIEFNIKLNDI